MKTNNFLFLLFICIFCKSQDNPKIPNLKKSTAIRIDTSFSSGERQIQKSTIVDEYDKSGRLVKHTVFEGKHIFENYKFTYSDAGLLISSYKMDSSKYSVSNDTKTFAYDHRNNKINEKFVWTNVGENAFNSIISTSWINTYNEKDSLSSVLKRSEFGDTEMRKYTYGPFGLVKEIALPLNKEEKGDSTISIFQYNEKGKLFKVISTNIHGKYRSIYTTTHIYKEPVGLVRIEKTGKRGKIETEYRTGNRTDSILHFDSDTITDAKKWFYRKDTKKHLEISYNASGKTYRDEQRYYYDNAGNLIKQYCWCDNLNETYKYYYKNGHIAKKEVFSFELLQSTFVYEYEFY